MNGENKLIIYTDGGARGNPGPAAYGVFITDSSGNKLAGLGKKIGETTNNIAEYSGVLAALTWVLETNPNFDQIDMYMDSQLVYSQLAGLYKVKNDKLRELLFAIREREALIKKPIRYFHIPRSKNVQADLLVNLALDKNN